METKRKIGFEVLALSGVSLVALLATPAAAQVTQRVSVASNGVQGLDYSRTPDISADGRYVAFHSGAATLVPGDTNGTTDVLFRDRQTGATERVSVDSSGGQGDGASADAALSADGRFVAFQSQASNLVPGDTNFDRDIFLRDRQSGTTERISISSAGVQGDGISGFPSVSDTGRYIAFYSFATNLVPGDTNGDSDVFVRDRQLGTTRRVSVDSAGVQGNERSFFAALSGDGRYVAFCSDASNLVLGDTNAAPDVFVHELATGTTERVSVDSAENQSNALIDVTGPSISREARYVVFTSDAPNLVAGDTNVRRDVFVRDRQAGITERVSVHSTGAEGNGQSYSGYYGAVSFDGRFVTFYSYSNNLFAGDTNGQSDVFLRDRLNGTTELISVTPNGGPGNSWAEESAISSDGRYVAFDSAAGNLVPSDTNDRMDVFVRDRSGGPEFTSLCDPGVGGVIACPCANPPSGLGRGCDNSSSTGGAVLSAAGGTYLSSDSVVFTTSGEKPTALSIVAQWTGGNATGVVFGMGVRCTAGSLKRLYTKSAVAGSITAPDFGAGDPQVSARSAALGDTIVAGASRWYLVYYRDATVLGGCPAASTFNATQTGQVTWQP